MVIKMISENIADVEKEIDKVCKENGRDRSEVTLIAVSKTKPVEMIEEAYNTGCRDTELLSDCNECL